MVRECASARLSICTTQAGRASARVVSPLKGGYDSRTLHLVWAKICASRVAVAQAP